MHASWLLVIASVWMATVGNVALWQQLASLPELNNGRGVAFAIGFAALIAVTLAALLSLFAWRWTLKPVLTILLLAAAAGAYFMMAYGIVVDDTMMVNVLQTDPRETRNLLNWRLFSTLVVLGALPALWLWRTPVKRLGVGRQLLTNALTFIASLTLLGGISMLIFQDFSSVMRNHTLVRYQINPLNTLYALGVVAAKPFQRDESITLPIGEDARLVAAPVNPGKPPLLVLMLGETARASSFSLNGYARPTNPELAALDVLSQRNAWSCGTNTAASLPCMFSHMGRSEFEGRAANYESLLDVLQRAGLAVLWIDNQSGCKGVCDRVPNVTTADLVAADLCGPDGCFDEIMLRGVEERIAALPADRRAKGVVLIFHQMGSHGPAYYKYSPAATKKFQPECQSNALQECSREQIINAYDNTIAYTDHFLASTIHWLKQSEKTSATALIYLSDHGESLGENNLFLHGLPYAIAPDNQKRVPWITWFSPSFERLNGISRECLKKNLDTAISHDNYFHSVLGLLGIQTQIYKKALDIYANCSRA